MKLLRYSGFLVLLLTSSLFGQERLVYAVTAPAPGGYSSQVFTIAPGDKQPAPLFSDASLPVILAFSPRSGTAPLETAVAGKSLFTPARERWLSSSARANAIYEFALDSPGKYRKILDLPPGERVDKLAVSSDGATLAYASLTGRGLTLFVHDVKSGRLLHHVDMMKIIGDCNLARLGWLPDNQTLFFTLETGDADSTTDQDYKIQGSWTMKPDGSSAAHLPPAIGTLKKPGYSIHPDLPPLMLGAINGQYVFNLWMDQRGSRSFTPGIFILFSDPRSGATESDLMLQQPAGLYWFLLSPSGRQLAYTQQGGGKFEGARYIVPPEHLWIQPLPSGPPQELLSMETSTQNRTSITLLGWMN